MDVWTWLLVNVMWLSACTHAYLSTFCVCLSVACPGDFFCVCAYVSLLSCVRSACSPFSMGSPLWMRRLHWFLAGDCDSVIPFNCRSSLAHSLYAFYRSVYLFIGLCAHVCVRVCIWVYASMVACVCICLCLCSSLYISAHVCPCMSVCIRVCMCLCASACVPESELHKPPIELLISTKQ